MTETEELELGIEKAKADKALADALIRLNQNADFNLLIIEGYLQKEAIRLVHEKVSSLKPDEVNRAIDSISFLNQYLHSVLAQGALAVNDILDSQNELDKLYEEA
jgi:hypothetical protein